MLIVLGVDNVIFTVVGQQISGYIYFAMAFSVFVEMLNIRLRKVFKPVKLHDQYRQ